MKVACVHYHFRRGGVTRVVQNAASSLAGTGVELLALSGEPPSAGFELPHVTIAELAYRSETSEGAGRALARRLQRAAHDHFGRDPDLWHFHNHSLGKNVDLPAAIRHLLEVGARVLLQIHDFAEDGRPLNFARLRKAVEKQQGSFAEWVYPAASQVHYAVLNQRDAAILVKAGVHPDRLHLLPNPVHLPPAAPDPATTESGFGSPLILYPTRGIRRKNLGEMLLLAALSKATVAPALFASTLRPENPEWLSIHRHWERLADELELPAKLAFAETHSFHTLIERANAVLTTSVAEGFGLAFLEPFLAAKPLIGRDLPEITSDFKDAGIVLDNLYHSLPVPSEFIDLEKLRMSVTAALRARQRAYGRPCHPQAPDRAFQSMLHEGCVDFGRLDEELQTATIRQALHHPERFPPIESLLKPTPSAAITHNRLRIRQSYNTRTYGHRLLHIYRTLATTSTSTLAALAPETILDAFLDPTHLNLLRT